MRKPRKEPIKNVKLWVVFGILFVLINPWYFPAGSYQPLLWGVPYWAWIILGVSLALSIFLSYVLKYEWRIEEDEERDAEDQ